MSTWILRDEQGRGPLRVAIKDLIDVAGLPTTSGCRALAELGLAADLDAACLSGLRQAMENGVARMVGKVGLHELAYGITGINDAFGTPSNPLDASLVPGGSSSGSAVAVATGEADVAYGSDTGGSIRIPAACCGVAGLKTTWGRIPLAGVWPLAPSLDTVGPMARDVAGLVAGMQLLQPGFTVAGPGPVVAGRLRPAADPVIDAAVDAALAATGWEVVEVGLDGVDAAVADAMAILDAEASASNRALVTAAPASIGAGVLGRLREAAAVTPAQEAAARAGQRRWQARLDRLWSEVEVLVAPTLVAFPPALDAPGAITAARSLCAAVNLAGVPALALPVPAAGALPASIQLIGPAGGEERLLVAGATLEAAAGWRG